MSSSSQHEIKKQCQVGLAVCTVSHTQDERTQIPPHKKIFPCECRAVRDVKDHNMAGGGIACRCQGFDHPGGNIRDETLPKMSWQGICGKGTKMLSHSPVPGNYEPTSILLHKSKRRHFGKTCQRISPQVFETYGQRTLMKSSGTLRPSACSHPRETSTLT